MHSFFYDVLKAKYGNRCKLLFTDTDWLCCEIKTHDLYEDITAGTLVPAVLMATSHSYGNGQTLTTPNPLTDYDKTLHN